jgi:hemerythrin superfamily protein
MSMDNQTSGSGRDVVSIIKDQHDQVRSLFARLKGATGEVAEETFCELRRMLAVHETAEEEVVYPALLKLGDRGKAVADARKEEESKAKTELYELEKMGVTDPKFPDQLASFNGAVEAHARQEEDTVLPLLQSNSGDLDLQKMGHLFEMAEAAAPTHPHPHAPESATGNLLVGPAVAIMDRVRDAIRAA